MRAPLPHKIYEEGDYDELFGKGHTGKEKQESVNAIYRGISQSRLSFCESKAAENNISQS